MSVRRNIAANYIGQGVASAVSLLLVPVYVRWLGIEAYALVGLFAVVQAWLGLLDLGLTPTLAREMARFAAGATPAAFIRDLLHSLGAVYAGIALLVGLGLTLAAPWLATHWLQPGALPAATVGAALALLGLVVALRFCEGLLRGGLMGLGDQVWVNGAVVLLTLLRSVGAVAVLAWVAPTLTAFFLWQALVSALTLAVLWWRLDRQVPPAPLRFSPAALHQVRGFAGGVFGAGLLGLVLTQLDKLILSRLLPLADYGYYMLAATAAGGLLLVSGPAVLALAPRLVRLTEAGDRAALAATYHLASQLVAVLLLPAALVLALFAPEVLLAWSGDAGLAARAAPVLALLALGTALNALMQVPYQLQLAAGWTRLALLVNVVAVLVLVPALLLGVPRYGGVAAAACWLALNLGYLLISLPIQHRRLLPGELGRWYAEAVLLPAGAAALVTGAARLALPADLGRWGWLAALAGIGLAALGAAALAAPALRRRLLARL